MNISSDDNELRQSIRLLDSVLTQVLKTQARPGTAATVEQLQQRFARLLLDGSLPGRQHHFAVGHRRPDELPLSTRLLPGEPAPLRL